MTTDASFLAEVEDFLTKCSLPGIPSLDCDGIDMTVSRSASDTRRKLEAIDAASKRELEKAKDRKRRRAYRERRRLERESLQREIEKLTKKLAELQAVDNFSAPAWQRLAQRQLAARHSSEALHRRLCEGIRVHESLILDFRRLMNDRLRSIENPRIEAASPHQLKRVRVKPSDTQVFALLIQELDGLFGKTDETLRAWGLESAGENWDEPSEAWINDADSDFFRFRGKITLPIDFRKLCKYRWHAAQLFHRQEGRELYDEVEDPDNTLAFKFRVTARLGSGKVATALQRFVVRRYEGSERTVLVWRIFTEGEGEFIGMHSDETGWGVATPTQSESRVGAVLRSCVRNVPLHINGSAPAAKQFNDKLLEWGLENHTKTTIALESSEADELLSMY